MALKFGPQWLRDLGDVGAGGIPQSPTTPPTCSVKFKLADYRYGREEMLALYNESSPPPDQVRKHLTIFSKDIQKPMTLTPLTEDEQRLISQGYNSTLVLRQAGRGSAPPQRVTRGGAVDRGRGRGRGEGYSRTIENGDIGYTRSTQDGWEQVHGRKFERSFSRGDEVGSAKPEFARSASDNWRDKRHEDKDDEDGGNSSWRNSRWGPSSQSSRPSWRDAPRDLIGHDNDRRPNLSRRDFGDLRRPKRTSESIDNDEVPEWVEDDMEDDPGTFDSKGVFVSTKENKVKETKDKAPSSNGTEKPSSDPSRRIEHTSPTDPNTMSRKPNHSLSSNIESHKQSKPGYVRSDSLKGEPDSIEVPSQSEQLAHSKKGDGDSGFAYPTKEKVNGTSAPPGQFSGHGQPENIPNNRQEDTSPPLRPDLHVNAMSESDTFSLVDKSLMNLVAEMTADTDRKMEEPINVAEHALPLTHENAHKWFYRDPQGEVQGPFPNDDMAQWFSAGYFTMSLIVKRGCDDSFKQLGELIKRYGRVPFLPGPPLPPLVTSTASLEMNSAVPPLISPMAAGPLPPTLMGGAIPGMQDPLMYQQLLFQQEYLKRNILLRQFQMQNLHQLQEQDAFKGLTLEQQQHLAMQMTMQSNPMTMQHIHHIQQQQLLTQQQQEKQNEQRRTSPPNVPLDVSNPSMSIPSSIPLSSSDSMKSNSRQPVTNAAAMSSGDDATSVWGHQNAPKGGEWSQQQPSSLWDVTPGSENVPSAYQAQIEKLKKEREEARLKEERMRQEALEQKQAELKRQQDEMEKQREMLRKEKEDLERQKQLEIQKLEEAHRQEEERLRQIEEEQRCRQLEEQKRQERRQLEEQKRQELERKKLEEEEERRKAELMRQAEEEKRKERELKKQEERKRKEESKKNQIEEQKAKMEELRKKEEQRRLHEEMLREQEQQKKEEERMRKEESERQHLVEQSERERQREEAEKEYIEAEKRQQAELLRQQESLRRLKQAQMEQLAKIQLPASSNWAAQQANQGSPVNSRSLMDIQAEEARRERENERERQAQIQQVQEKATVMSQQNQQKSWATHASHNVPKGPSLLDIQQQEQQEQEVSRKSNKSHQSKMPLSTASTWSNPLGSQHIWSAQSWDSGLGGSGSIWETPAAVTRTGSGSKKIQQSGDFPALRNPAQSGGNKNSAKANKSKNSKKPKEEETVQKLFQSNQKQDSFSDWVSQRVAKFSAPIDVPTFVSFIVEVDNPEDVKDYMKTYLGDTKEIRDFSKQFIEKRSSYRNQARLEKQQEEDSIWGPAPAVNPYIPTRGGNTGSNATSNVDSNEGSAKAKKKTKKQKMQKLDMSALGFTVHADPNRKNAAGEFESVQ